MGVSEEGTFFCQPINVGGFHIWMAFHAAYPIILIIDGNEKNIGFVLGRILAQSKEGKQRCKISEHDDHLSGFFKNQMIPIVMELKPLESIFIRLGSKVGVLAAWRLGMQERSHHL